MKPKIVVISGPTASGKTDLALQVARQFNGEIISADSRTIFREMNIGTAKPEGEKIPATVITRESVEEKGLHEANKMDIHALFDEKPYMVEGIPHWGINVVDPNESFTAAQFKLYAEQKIENILQRKKLPIIAGGTGLYISAIVDNLSFADSDINEAFRSELKELSNEQLIERLRAVDVDAIDAIDTENRRRLIRAIEIIETTGKKLKEQQKKGEPRYDALQIGLKIERDELYARINDRVDMMIANGLVDEVRALKDKYGCEVNAMTGIGYRQICAFLEGYMTLRDAIDVLKRDSRHYAKRQMTWFRRDTRINWVENTSTAINQISDFIA